MEYSSFSRSNMRHRGPMESQKMNKIYVHAYNDINRLYKRLNALKEETISFKQDMRENERTMSSEANLIQEKALFLKGGDSRE